MTKRSMMTMTIYEDYVEDINQVQPRNEINLYRTSINSPGKTYSSELVINDIQLLCIYVFVIFANRKFMLKHEAPSLKKGTPISSNPSSDQMYVHSSRPSIHPDQAAAHSFIPSELLRIYPNHPFTTNLDLFIPTLFWSHLSQPSIYPNLVLVAFIPTIYSSQPCFGRIFYQTSIHPDPIDVFISTIQPSRNCLDRISQPFIHPDPLHIYPDVPTIHPSQPFLASIHPNLPFIRTNCAFIPTIYSTRNWIGRIFPKHPFIPTCCALIPTGEGIRTWPHIHRELMACKVPIQTVKWLLRIILNQ